MAERGSRVFVLVFSHGVAFVLGWLLMTTGSDDKPSARPEAATAAGEARTRSSRIRERVGGETPAGRLIWSLLDADDAMAGVPEILPAKDRAAAARAAIDAWVAESGNEDLLHEAQARFGHWLEIEPKEALIYWNGSGIGTSRALALFSEIIVPRLDGFDVPTLTAWLKTPTDFSSGPARELILNSLGKSIAKAGDLALLKETAAELDASAQAKLYLTAFRGWPPEKLAGLETCLRANPNQELVLAYVDRMKPEPRLAWLRGVIEGDDPLAKMLTSGRLAGSIAYYASGASLDERMDLMSRVSMNSGGPATPEETRARLLSLDVMNWLNTSGAGTEGTMADWQHRFRNGEISAQQILAEAKRALPELASTQAEELRRTVFSRMAAVNPAQAVALLSDLPLQEREKLMLKAAASVAGAADPKVLYELVSQIPVGVTSSANDRFQVWTRATAPAYRKYGDSYTAWILGLPHGVERDMALSVLAFDSASRDPELAASLKAAKTLPPGWRPGP